MVDHRLTDRGRTRRESSERGALLREAVVATAELTAARVRAKARARDLIEQYLAPYERAQDEGIWKAVQRNVPLPEMTADRTGISETDVFDSHNRERRRRLGRSVPEQVLSLNAKQREILSDLRDLDLALPEIRVDAEGTLTAAQRRYLDTVDALVRKAVNADISDQVITARGLSRLSLVALEASLARSRTTSRWYMEYLLPIHGR